MDSLEQITNFIALGDRFATAGMPEREQFSAIAEAGYQVVVNLACLDSPGQQADEAALLESLGLQYIHIPVAWENPQLSDVERFFEALETHSQQRIFIHCVLNYRVSAFVYLFRTLRQAIPHEQAWADLNRIWHPEGKWAAFIQSARQAFTKQS